MDDTLDLEFSIITKNFSDLASLQKEIANTIMENHNAFLPLLDRLIDMGDARMSVNDDSLNVESTDVNIDLKTYEGFTYGTFYSFYYAGCKDMNSENDHEVELPFTIEDNKLIFNLEIPPAWRPGECE